MIETYIKTVKEEMANYRKRDESSSDSSTSDESIDPLSPHFDPMKALYAKSVKLPVPSAKQFNNVAEFENYMKGKDAKTMNKDKPKASFPGIVAKRAAEQAKESVRKAAIMAKSQGPSKPSQTLLRRQHNTNVIMRMEKYDKGPLSLLKRSVKDRLRVVVVVRAAVAVRSRCRGYVIGFDKHFNMGLMDVDEIILKPIKVEKESHKEDQQAIAASKSETRTSGFKQKGSQLPGSSASSRLLQSEDDLSIKADVDQAERDAFMCSIFMSERKQQGKELGKESLSRVPGLAHDCSASNRFMNMYKPWAEQRCYTKYEIVERHVNQLFLRGDNVVSVILDQS